MTEPQTDATTPEGVDWGPTRAKTIEWHDPAGSARWAQQLDGLEFIQAVVDGVIPAPPIASLMDMRFLAAEKGSVVFELEPDESMYNPIGGIHGGTMCTLLDSVVGCAVHTTLPAGVGYTSVEIKVNFIRAATQHSGILTAIGTVKKGGRRIAFAEGEVTDAEGKVVATATSTILVFEIPGADA